MDVQHRHTHQKGPGRGYTSCAALQSSSLCSALPSLSGLVRPSNRTGTDYTGLPGLQRSGANLPSVQDLSTSRVRSLAGNITADTAHPGHNPCQLLPSGRRYRALNCTTTRHKSSFFPQAITLMNTSPVYSVRNNPRSIYLLIILLLNSGSHVHISDTIPTMFTHEWHIQLILKKSDSEK